MIVEFIASAGPSAPSCPLHHSPRAAHQGHVHRHRAASPHHTRLGAALLLSGAMLTSTAHAGPDPCGLGSPLALNVSNSGFAAYTINAQSNPALTLVRGCTYTFNINASGHPFLIKSVQGTGTANTYHDGVTNNGAQNGVLTWTVAANAPDSVFYNCQFHAPMTGAISIIDSTLPDAVFTSGFE